MTPDPYRASGGPGVPQSWNRYAYVIGDPLNLIDPRGTTYCFINPSTGAVESCYDSVDVSAGLDGGSGGGAKSGTTNVPTDPLGLSAQQARLLALAWQNQVKNHDLNSCQALADFAADAADQSKNEQQFVNSFGAFVEKDLATQLGGIAYNTGPVSLYSGGDNGFASLFQNTLPDNNPNAGDNGDQAHHFAAFLEFGYKWGAGVGSLTAFALEVAQSLGSMTLNKGDVELGIFAAELGWRLDHAQITAFDVADIIRGVYCH
jgi:hypothetical protein